MISFEVAAGNGEPAIPRGGVAVASFAIYRLAVGMANIRGCEEQMATGPDMRIGDADREAAAAGLREHYAQGRLTLEEFNQRLDATFAAATESQLRRITRDLPHTAAPSAPLPSAAIGPYHDRARRDYRHGGHGWQGGHPRPRGRALSTLIAITATWLIMIMLVLPDLRFPCRASWES